MSRKLKKRMKADPAVRNGIIAGSVAAGLTTLTVGGSIASAYKEEQGKDLLPHPAASAGVLALMSGLNFVFIGTMAYGATKLLKG